MEGFEEFDQYHSRSVKTNFVTIQRRGNFSLNRAAFKALGEPTAVKLLFNRSKRQIAFKATSPTEHRSAPVRKQGVSESYMVGGLTFCKEFDIDTSTARRYEGKIQEGMLIVDLNEPSTDATGPRLRDDVSAELQGKQERRLARRISERPLTSSDEVHRQLDTANQEDQKAATAPVRKLSLEEKAALEDALRRGELSDGLLKAFRANTNNIQA